jgi:chorismate mutase
VSAAVPAAPDGPAVPDGTASPSGPRAKAVRALRGATTIDQDTIEQINDRVQTLVRTMLDRNGVDKDDLISIVFTATDDIHAMFPATAARAIGLGDVPLICARELNIDGGTPRCIRVLMHLTTTHRRNELHHVYLEAARALRDDLPE